MNANKKFVVWDWNGTLLDDTGAVLECVNIILAKLQRDPISLEYFQDIQTRPLEHFYRAAGVVEENLATALEHERSIFHDTYEPMADTVPLRHGAADLLQKLRAHNVSNVIVSNHITGQIIRLLDKHDIHRHFDEVIAYVSRGKQFRDMTKGEKLQVYIRTNGLNTSNAVIIGDTMEEIEIARDLGMTSVAITGGIHSEQRLRAKQPHHVIHSLHELRPILQERGFIA